MKNAWKRIGNIITLVLSAIQTRYLNSGTFSQYGLDSLFQFVASFMLFKAIWTAVLYIWHDYKGRLRLKKGSLAAITFSMGLLQMVGTYYLLNACRTSEEADATKYFLPLVNGVLLSAILLYIAFILMRINLTRAYILIIGCLVASGINYVVHVLVPSTRVYFGPVLPSHEEMRKEQEAFLI